MKKLLMLAAISLLFVTGCGVAKMENGEDAVASLDNGKISINDLYAKMKDDYALNILLDMIDTKLLEDLYKSDSEEQEYIAGLVEQVQYYQQLMAEQYPTVDQFLQSNYGIRDLDAYKAYLKLSYKRSKAVEDYAKKLVTDKEIEDYYDNKAIGDISAKHILIKVNVASDDTEEEKEQKDKEALEKAKSIIAELKAGKNFDDLAKEHSDDGTAKDGGKLDDFNRGDMVTEFEEAAIALKKGEYSTEPVKTEFGYHIIFKVDQKEKPKLEDIKDDIIDAVSEDKLTNDSKISTKALIEFRKDHKIKIEDSELNKQYKRFVESY
jgi:Parvulin-like peptidyl-prolyl isomerase